VLSALLVAPTLALVGCSGEEVVLPDVDVDPDERAACQALVDDLPAELGGRERVPVTPTGGLGAAWGEPAIVLTCGGEPPAISRTASCTEVNDVGWYVEEQVLDDESAPATLVAVGYRPIVTLEVPSDQRPEGAAAAMAGLAASVEAHAELVQPCL
jgi:hypothetical protein